MTYQEAYNWLIYQEDFTEEQICNILNGEGSYAIINLAEDLYADGDVLVELVGGNNV